MAISDIGNVISSLGQRIEKTSVKVAKGVGTLISGLEKVAQKISGWAANLVVRLGHLIWNLPKALNYGIYRLMRNLKKGFKLGIKLAKNLWKAALYLFENFAEVMAEVANDISQFCRLIVKSLISFGKQILRGLHHIITHIPKYLSDLFRFGKKLIDMGIKVMSFIKINFIEICKTTFSVLREALVAMIKEIVHGSQWLLNQGVLALGVGYALNLALVNLLGKGLNAICSGLGVQIPESRVFTAIKFSLSVGLSGFGLFHVASVSYLGLGGLLLGLGILNKVLDEPEAKAKVSASKPVNTKKKGVKTNSSASKPIVHQYQQKIAGNKKVPKSGHPIQKDKVAPQKPHSRRPSRAA